MPTTKISGRESRPYVQERQPFTNHNKQLYGEWASPHLYVVYSYGPHWPLFIWSEDTRHWYANADKASRTTSKHYGMAHPLQGTRQRPCAWMKDAVAKGTAFILLPHCDEAQAE
jgi:hypothetical protein